MSLGIAYATKKRAKCAKGGEVNEKAEYDPVEEPGPVHNEAAAMEDADMIARIMHKRKEYSQGGMVANDSAPIADEMPAEYDDLVLDDTMEDNSSAGNEHGDAAQDERDGDVIAKIMRSRAKKDRMPRPA